MDALSRATDNAITLTGISQTLFQSIPGSSHSAFALLCQLKKTLADLLICYKQFLHQVLSRTQTFGLLEDTLDACFLLRRSLWERYQYPLLRSVGPSYSQLLLRDLVAITRRSRPSEPRFATSHESINRLFETLAKSLSEFHRSLSELYGLEQVDVAATMSMDKEIRRSLHDLNLFRSSVILGENRRLLPFHPATSSKPPDAVSFDKRLHGFFESIAKHPSAQIRALPRVLTTSLSALLAIIQDWKGAFYISGQGGTLTRIDITPALNAMFNFGEEAQAPIDTKVGGVYVWQAIVHFRRGIRANTRSFHYWAQHFCRVYEIHQEGKRWINRLRSGYIELGAVYALAAYSLLQTPPPVPTYAFAFAILYPTVFAFLKHFSFLVDQLKFRLVIPVVGCYCVLLWHMEGGPRLPPPSTTILFGLNIPASKTFVVFGEPFRLTTLAIASLLALWYATKAEPLGTFFTMVALIDLFLAHIYGQDEAKEMETESIIRHIPDLVQDLQDIASAWEDMELVLDSYECREGTPVLSRAEQVRMFDKFKTQCMPFEFDRHDASDIERVARTVQRMGLTGNMLHCQLTHPKEYCTAIDRGKACPLCLRHKFKKKKTFREREEDRVDEQGVYKLADKRVRVS